VPLLFADPDDPLEFALPLEDFAEDDLPDDPLRRVVVADLVDDPLPLDPVDRRLTLVPDEDPELVPRRETDVLDPDERRVLIFEPVDFLSPLRIDVREVSPLRLLTR